MEIRLIHNESTIRGEVVPGSHPPKVGRDRWFSSPQALLMGGQSKGWLGTSLNKFNLRKIQKNTLLSEEKTNLRKIQKKPLY